MNTFKYTYNNKTSILCDLCYINIEEYIKENKNLNSLKFTKKEIKEIQIKNQEITNKIKKLDFSLFPRTFLEEFLEYIKKQEFFTFKKLLKEYQEQEKIKVI